MSLNRVTLNGRVPFDLELKNADDEKKAFLGFSVSVQRNYKPEGEKYYPEDLLYCKAFGSRAAHIAKYFKKGDGIIVEGELRRDDDREDETTKEVIRGQMYVNVTDVHFVVAGKRAEGETAAKEEKPAKTAEKPASRSNPFAKK